MSTDNDKSGFVVVITATIQAVNKSGNVNPSVAKITATSRYLRARSLSELGSLLAEFDAVGQTDRPAATVTKITL